jgi:chemotaxis protein MotA
MDTSTIVGVSAGVIIMMFAVILGGAPFSIFVDYPAILCVLGGTMCSVFICYPFRAIKLLPAAILKTVLVKSPDTRQIIQQLTTLSEIARRDGLLALENRVQGIRDPFLQLGMRLTIDGTKPDIIQDVLQTELQAISTRHSLCKSMLDQCGKYAPAFGMIGTLLGLVMMLNNMSDPSAIGSGMAVALLTTLYGAVLSNLFCLPMSEKLAFYHREEMKARELMIKGIMAIQSGENPRIVEQKLVAVLHPSERLYRRAA